MNAVTLQRMRWWHVPAVRRIEAESFTGTAWTEGQFWGELAHVPESREYVVALVETETDTQGDTRIGESTVIGYAGINVVPPEADVQTIAVDGGHRRHGVGRILLAHLLERAEDRGCTQVFLEVHEANVAAIAMYESFGFERIQVRRDYYGRGEHGIVMRRRIGAAA